MIAPADLPVSLDVILVLALLNVLDYESMAVARSILVIAFCIDLAYILLRIAMLF